MVKWAPPPFDYVKVNCDGSVKDKEGASGYVIRNHYGKIVGAGARYLGHTSILLAEATGLRDGVKRAVDMGYRNLEIEGDSTVVIQALWEETEKPWKIDNLIRDTGKFLSLCGIVNVQHTYREGNRAADLAANMGHMFKEPIEWKESLSLELDNILYADELGMTLERRAS